LLSETIAASFHIDIVPPKIPAMVAGEKFNVCGLSSLYITAIGAATTGTWITVGNLVAAVCGVSEKLKSPIPLSEADRPAPEPPPEYVKVLPVAAVNPALQESKSGITNVDPDPVKFTFVALFDGDDFDEQEVRARAITPIVTTANFQFFEIFMYFPQWVYDT
jgi:hypothetical protein